VADDGGLALVDGALYRDPSTDAEGQPADPDGAVLSAWRRRGESLLPALRGDFALLLWDGRRGLLARDQMGGRIWVWHDDGRRLHFASEVHLLLALLPRRPRPDDLSMAHWLGVSGIPGDGTLYDGIRRLQAGSQLPLDSARTVAPARFWSLRPPTAQRVEREEYTTHLRDALTTAVSRRLEPNGRDVAVMLSGGLDSASVAGLAAAAVPPLRRPKRAYSAVFPDHPTVDESSLVDGLVHAYGLQSVRASVRRGSVLEGALPYLERWALPPVSPNLFFWLPLLHRAASDGVVVMLDGEGGDELFGLSPYLIADRLSRARVRAAVDLVSRIPGAAGRPSRAAVVSALRQFGLLGLAPPAAHALYRRFRSVERYAPGWLRAEMAGVLVASTQGDAWKRQPGPRWWAFLVDAVIQGMGPALAYDHVRRRAAMAGIAARHPLVDVDVIELVMRLPPEAAFDPHLSRPMLRSAVAEIVPDDVRLRPSKSTFDAIFHESLAGSDLPLCRGLLCDPAARVGAYVDLARMRADLLVPDPPRGPARATWALQLWRLLTAECWLRFQEDPAGPRRVAERIGLPTPDCVLVP
jgi:asparagine synthase (glutamine-hydrolysing)